MAKKQALFGAVAGCALIAAVSPGLDFGISNVLNTAWNRVSGNDSSLHLIVMETQDLGNNVTRISGCTSLPCNEQNMRSIDVTSPVMDFKPVFKF